MIREDGTSSFKVGPFWDGTLAECAESGVKVHAVKGRDARLQVKDSAIAIHFPTALIPSIHDVLGKLLDVE